MNDLGAFYLSAKKLLIGYRHRPLIQAIDFIVPHPCTLLILGLNGSGKSTLLRTLAGLQKPLSGEVMFGAKIIEQYSAIQLAQLRSVVLTGNRSIVQTLLVKELLLMARHPYSGFTARFSEQDLLLIQEISSLVRIETLLEKLLYALSDGELQKVMIARALVQETPYIFLDEPTSHLDVVNRKNIYKVLEHIAEVYKKTIVFTAHDVEDALRIADYVLVLDNDGSFAFNTKSDIESNEIVRNLFEL